jgi:hypothetical protein
MFLQALLDDVTSKLNSRRFLIFVSDILHKVQKVVKHFCALYGCFQQKSPFASNLGLVGAALFFDRFQRDPLLLSLQDDRPDTGRITSALPAQTKQQTDRGLDWIGSLEKPPVPISITSRLSGSSDCRCSGFLFVLDDVKTFS